MSYLQRYFYRVPEGERHPGAITFYASLDSVAAVSPEVATATLQELRDQSSHLKLIASENYSSLAVQQAMGTLLTDKYAEGFAGHRFYAGCENVDRVEREAENEAKLLFGAEAVYVQPHSGADANLVAFWAILTHRIQQPYLGERTLNALSDKEHEEMRQQLVNQTVMGMDLGAGGHLSHGYRHHCSAKMMRSVSYGVDPETGLLDYAALAKQVKEVKPTILLAGYSAYPRRLNFAHFQEIAKSVGATLLVDMAHFAGLVAGRVFTGEENPIPYADIVTTTTHKTLRGPRGGLILCQEEYASAVRKGCPLVLGGPLPHVIAAKAVAFQEANRPSFSDYAHQIVENARTLAEELSKRGATILTGGTDNHLLLVDVRSYGLTGRGAEGALRQAGITVNRNAIPADPHGPWETSGIRLGTPALTTLGMKGEEMQKVAQWIDEILRATKPATEKADKKSPPEVEEASLHRVQYQLRELLASFPLYPELCVEELENGKRITM